MQGLDNSIFECVRATTLGQVVNFPNYHGSVTDNLTKMQVWCPEESREEFGKKKTVKKD